MALKESEYNAGFAMSANEILSDYRRISMSKRHRIQFPKSEVSKLNQDEAYFYLQGSGGQRKIRFHDYDEIYQLQGLYEQVFYDRLKCTSPAKVATILESAVRQSEDNFTEPSQLILN